MPVIVYLDETGDHSLEAIDENFPVFVLVLLICDVQKYVDQIVPAIYRLKFDYFGHEGVILRSRSIRKAEGDFGFLTDPEKRRVFYERLNKIMKPATTRSSPQRFGSRNTKTGTGWPPRTLMTLH